VIAWLFDRTPLDLIAAALVAGVAAVVILNRHAKRAPLLDGRGWEHRSSVHVLYPAPPNDAPYDWENP
jgi:hypothetical protein